MASGDSLILFLPEMAQLPSSNAAAWINRNVNSPIMMLAFDDTTNQSAIFKGLMPQQYGVQDTQINNPTGITVYIHFAMATATTGDVDWDIELERIGDGQQDIDSDGFAAANSVDNNTVPATAGHVSIVNVTFTDGVDMDSIESGETFRLRITRDASSDTATGDAQLHAIEIRET